MSELSQHRREGNTQSWLVGTLKEQQGPIDAHDILMRACCEVCMPRDGLAHNIGCIGYMQQVA